MLARRLALARTVVEVTEAEVAVSGEGAHPAVLAAGKRLAVVRLG